MTSRFKKPYKYDSKEPIEIDVEDLTHKQKHLLMESKTFCMLPWIHLHGYPSGKAYPCCHSEYNNPVGDLRKNTITEIWNDTPMRELRTRMLTDVESTECRKCYQGEQAGAFTMRNSFNKHFGHHIARATDKTRDGVAEDTSLVYWDIRFNNLCNFKCRTCGVDFSSKWWEDDNKMYGPLKTARVQYAGKDPEDIWQQMLPHIDTLEQVYFAGGEPLLMEEHYRLVNELVKRKKFHVRLAYNTNFSKISYKKQNILELWKLFDSVSIGASIDASGARAEYIRKETVWDEIERNREQMLRVCPNVDFYISPTLSIFNAYNIMDLHKSWVSKGYIRHGDVNVNLLLDPPYYRIDNLPDVHKQELTHLYNEHIEWLAPHDRLARATTGFKSAIGLLANENNMLRKFFSRTDQLDALRNEKFHDVFPEYSDLRFHVK
jgi:radical SAM protein with 4Fe4S-binding SPASM domain